MDTTGASYDVYVDVDVDEEAEGVPIHLKCSECYITFGNLTKYTDHLKNLKSCLTDASQSIECPVKRCSYISKVYNKNTALTIRNLADHIRKRIINF